MPHLITPRPYDVIPEGRCSLSEFLAITQMTKNTFFLAFRHNPSYAALLDIQKNAARRMHMPREAAEVIACERRVAGKLRHGNKRRTPQRPCPRCGVAIHPRHTWCDCGWEA